MSKKIKTIIWSSAALVVLIAIIFIGVIPLIVLAIGIVVFVRRRHL